MARNYLTSINLNKNELQNAAVQNLGTAPVSPVKGQLYFNSTGGDNTLYWWDGTTWVPAKATATIAFGTITAETTFGTAKNDGASSNAARADHQHGNPTHDAAAHSAIPLSALQAPFGPATADTVFGSSVNNGVSNSAARADHIHGNPVHDAAAHANISRSVFLDPVGNISWAGFKITSLGTPTAGSDAANKTYVDNMAAGLVWKAPVRLASTGNVALTGLTAIDGVTPIAADRVLLKNQTAPAENGIWAAAAGAWARATDADSSAELVDAAVFVSEGTANSDSAWVQTANAPITVGTTALPWVQFAGGGAVTAGAGMTQTGNVLDVVAANGSIVVGVDNIQVGYAGTGGAFGSAVTATRSDHNHDAQYVDVVGDTMTGLLTINKTGVALTTPAGTIDASTFTAHGTGGGLTSTDGGFVSLSGSGASLSVSGAFSSVDFANLATQVVLPTITPTAINHATTKQYVDGLVTGKANKYTGSVGGSTAQVITHNLNTTDVVVNVYRTAAPGDTVECDVERTNATSITLRFAVAPSASEYRVAVIG